MTPLRERELLWMAIKVWGIGAAVVWALALFGAVAAEGFSLPGRNSIQRLEERFMGTTNLLENIPPGPETPAPVMENEILITPQAEPFLPVEMDVRPVETQEPPAAKRGQTVQTLEVAWARKQIQCKTPLRVHVLGRTAPVCGVLGWWDRYYIKIQPRRDGGGGPSVVINKGNITIIEKLPA